jgi:hypothetical protein
MSQLAQWLRGALRRPLTVAAVLAVLGAGAWAISQPALQLAASCAGGGYGGSGYGGYGAPTGTCGPYVPLTPTRVLDTRNGTGGVSGAVGPGQTISINIAGTAGVPATGASAVVLNVTATDPTSASYVTVFPEGNPLPLASNLNFGPGQTVANLVEVQLGSNGAVSFFNQLGDVQLVADLEGYVATTAQGSAGLFTPVTPYRLLDTRIGLGAPPGPVSPGATVRVLVTGVGGIPATGVGAVAFNLTATDATGPSYITAYPDSQPRPLASNLNFVNDETIANRVIVPVVNGYVDLFNDFSGSDTQLVLDVNGYFSSSSASSASGSDFNSQVPQRIVDTRPGSGQGYAGQTLGPGGVLTVQVAGFGGVPSMTSSSPPTAVALNVTVTDPSQGSYLTVWPSNVTQPGTSDINYGPSQTQPNLVVVGLSPTGQVSFFNQLGTVDIVVDVEGWYS